MSLVSPERLSRPGYTRIHFREIGSTNDEAAKYVRAQGAKAVFPVAFSADSQTAGRGRSGKSFASIGAFSVYLSVVLKAPSVAGVIDPGLITIAAGVAAHRALRSVLPPGDVARLGIKWVNDIFLDDRKVGGILTELVAGAVVIGIGINIGVTATELEGVGEDVRRIAGGVMFAPDPENPFVDVLTREVIAAYEELVSERLPGGSAGCEATLSRVSGGEPRGGGRSVMDEYRSVEITTGHPITYMKTGCEPVPAFALRIEDDGGLLVEYEDGSREILTAGEVSCIPAKKTSEAYSVCPADIL